MTNKAVPSLVFNYRNIYLLRIVVRYTLAQTLVLGLVLLLGTVSLNLLL